MKSRSLVASMELAVGAANPNSRAAMVRSRARVAPATAPEPSGHWLRCAEIAQALGVAQDHFDVGKQPVSNQHRLSTLQMRIAGHNGFARGVGLCNQSIGPCGKRFDY